MADILIRSIKMPDCCYHCFALDDNGDYPRCLITQEQRGYTFQTRENRMDKCPLIVLPDGHGDLIDKDEAMNAILDEPTDAHYPSWFAGIVNEEPAVVPAEKGK